MKGAAPNNPRMHTGAGVVLRCAVAFAPSPRAIISSRTWRILFGMIDELCDQTAINMESL